MNVNQFLCTSLILNLCILISACNVAEPNIEKCPGYDPEFFESCVMDGDIQRVFVTKNLTDKDVLFGRGALPERWSNHSGSVDTSLLSESDFYHQMDLVPAHGLRENYFVEFAGNKDPIPSIYTVSSTLFMVDDTLQCLSKKAESESIVEEFGSFYYLDSSYFLCDEELIKSQVIDYFIITDDNVHQLAEQEAGRPFTMEVTDREVTLEKRNVTYREITFTTYIHRTQ